jgi:hypothetical protein
VEITVLRVTVLPRLCFRDQKKKKIIAHQFNLTHLMHYAIVLTKITTTITTTTTNNKQQQQQQKQQQQQHHHQQQQPQQQ